MILNKTELMSLYLKERDYEKEIFGDYEKNPCFNVATFLNFLDQYIAKAKKSYANEWIDKRPPWLLSCNEHKHQACAPVKTYEELIKIFALAGAALEAFTEIDHTMWREEGIKDKWKK